jgi:acyl-coenzyme A synthetase/AMP-(fatty) acid ligase
VKINGYRIELPDVQHALARHPAIAQCVVVGKRNASGEAVLVAYYTARASARPTNSELRTSLAKILPDYMIPGVFAEIAQLPMTQNGKIDVKALPDPFALSRANARAGGAVA